MIDHLDATTLKPRELKLFSPARSIEHIELASLLQQKFSRNCQLCFDPYSIDPRDLLLFDCKEISAARIEKWLLGLQQRQLYRKCALINVEENSLYERLMDWPQVAGIFYLNYSESLLLDGLNKILQGKLSLPERLYQEFVHRLRRPPSKSFISAEPVNLTRRELQILEGIYSGFTNARIANRLKLSEHTIKSHLSNAYRKLGINSRLEACTWMRDNYAFITN